MADVVRFDIVSNAHSEGLKDAAHDLEALRGESDKTNQSFRKLSDNSKAVQRDIKSHGDAVRVLREEYKQTQTKIRELNIELLRGGGSESIIKRQLRTERSALRDLARAGTEIGVTLGTSAAAGFSKTFAETFEGAQMPALVGAVGGLVTAAAPGLAALIGGALTGALGTGAMAAGILSASQDAGVKSAAKQFGDDLMGEFFSGGPAFAGPIMSGLDILRQGVRGLGIQELLAPLAPTVITIAHGIADFVNNLKDAGLAATFARMEGFAHIAAEGLAQAGDALGFFFDEVSKDKGSMDGLRAFFAILNGTVRLAAVGINFLEGVFHSFSVAAVHVATLANKISFGHLDELQRGAERVLGVMPQVSGQLVHMHNSAHEVTRRLNEQAEAMQRLADEAEATTRALDDFLGVQLSAAQSNLAVEQGYMRMREAIAENGRTLDVHTKQGLANREAILSQIGAIERQREATIRSTGDVKGANAEYDRALDRLKQMAKVAGITGEALDALVGDYYIRLHIEGLQNAIAQMVGQVFGNLPWAKKRAHGGPVMAGEPYIVGDGGKPELFVPRQNGMIIPEVPRSGGGSSMGSSSSQGNARPLVLNGGGLGEVVFAWLRTEVAARGGTLAVLGLRAA